MQSERMKRAGWACIASAIITIPILIMSFYAAYVEAKSANVILSLIVLFLFIYIFYSLKLFLNEQFDFHLVDAHIMALIYLNAGATFISVIATKLDVFLAICLLLALIASGIIMIAFSITLMKLEEPFGGLLKPFCYLAIAQGVCTASVVLILLGPLPSIAADIVLAIIFLRSADTVLAQTDKNT